MSKTWRMVVVLLAAGVGCTGNSGDAPPTEAGSSTRILGSQDASFEMAKDPPFTVTTHFAAGQLAESQGKFNVAIEQYRKALELDAMHAPTLYRLGRVYAQMRQHEQAIQTWQQYIKATHGDATGYSNLAFSYELAGRAADAEAAYLKGIGIDPKNEPCRVNYGLMLARAGRLEQAVEHLGAVLRPAEVHYNIGSVLEQQGRRQEAKAAYQKALQADPAFSWAQQRLAAME